MKNAKRWVIVLLSIIVAGLKGLKIFFDPVSPNGTDWSENSYGWRDPRMSTPWQRVRSGNEPLSHTLTNLIVEWFEMDKESLRRGVKMLSGALVVSWLLILLLVILSLL